MSAIITEIITTVTQANQVRDRGMIRGYNAAAAILTDLVPLDVNGGIVMEATHMDAELVRDLAALAAEKFFRTYGISYLECPVEHGTPNEEAAFTFTRRNTIQSFTSIGNAELDSFIANEEQNSNVARTGWVR